MAYLHDKAPAIKPAPPRPQHWLSSSIGRSGFTLSTTINTKEDRLGVEIYITGESSKENYSALLKSKEYIEQKLGFQLDWQELPDANACRIATWLLDAPLDNEKHWPKYMKWVTDRMTKMDEVLRPIIKSLD